MNRTFSKNLTKIRYITTLNTPLFFILKKFVPVIFNLEVNTTQTRRWSLGLSKNYETDCRW